MIFKRNIKKGREPDILLLVFKPILGSQALGKALPELLLEQTQH